MRIAMIASEAAPFVKTGGLGDVLQALPTELARSKGTEVSLFLPYYKSIKYDSAVTVEALSSFNINLTSIIGFDLNNFRPGGSSTSACSGFCGRMG